MDFFDVFAIPERPKLRFGEPLHELCGQDTFHPALKDLFLKAYLNARGDEDSESSTTPLVLLALKAGTSGQGSLAQRMRLKSRLELGEWLLPCQTPAGAPLWLLRHFLGRLPQPLLKESQWKELADACAALLLSGLDYYYAREVLERIAVSARALSRLEFELLALLALLMRKLAMSKEAETLQKQLQHEQLNTEVLNELAQYFIASIIARPYRPGLCTRLDKDCQPLLICLAKYWSYVFEESSISMLPANEVLAPRDGGLLAGELARRGRSRYIGFESLLIVQDNEEPKESSDNDSEPRGLRKRNATGDLSVIKRDFTLIRSAVARSANKKSYFDDSDVEIMSGGDETLRASEKLEIENSKAKSMLLSDKSGALIGPSPSEKTTCDIYEIEKNINTKYGWKFLENSLDEFQEKQFESDKNTVKPSFSEHEFFSVPNSEDSQ